MSMRKLSLSSRRYRIADNLSIEQNKVREIIDRYIELCREDLLTGHVVRIFGLVTLVPNTVTDNFIATTAWYSRRIAEETVLPYYTILGTIKEYLESMQKTLLSGKDVTIPRLVGMYSLRTTNNTYKVRSQISETVTKEVSTGCRCVTAVRVHTDKLFKEYVATVSATSIKEG